MIQLSKLMWYDPTGLESLLHDVCSGEGVTLAEIRNKTRKYHYVKARTKFIDKAIREGYKATEIADLLNINRTTVYHHIR